jgi:hypothetical protein
VRNVGIDAGLLLLLLLLRCGLERLLLLELCLRLWRKVLLLLLLLLLLRLLVCAD